MDRTLERERACVIIHVCVCVCVCACVCAYMCVHVRYVLCVAGWVCVCHETSVREGMYVFNIIADTLAGSR